MMTGRDARVPGDRKGDEPRERGGSPGLEPLAACPDRSTIKIVLLVGEHAEIREILTHYLIRQDLIAMPVPNAAQALVVCETVAPDVVLLDLALPDPESLALIGHIKARRPGIPLVVISGSPVAEWEARCRAKGADDVLPRPIHLERLGQILARRLHLPPEHFRRASPPRSPAKPRAPSDGTGY